MTFGIIIGSKKRSQDLKRNNSYDLRDVKNSPLSHMERDKVMVRMIHGGKASDKGLKREAESIQREHEDNRKSKMRQKDARELHEIRKDAGLLKDRRLRRQYGYSE